MFFCSRSSVESPRETSPSSQRRQSLGGQDLSEYLKAYRNKETVDQDWRRVHMKGRGKKRFKKLVNRQIMLSKIQKMGEKKVRDTSASSAQLQSERFKPRGSLHESFLFTDREKQRLEEIAQRNDEKKSKREEYIRLKKTDTDSEHPSSAQSRKRAKKWRSRKDKISGTSYDLEASVRSLENALKVSDIIDEIDEDPDEDDGERNRAYDEDKEENEQENDEDTDHKNEDDQQQDEENENDEHHADTFEREQMTDEEPPDEDEVDERHHQGPSKNLIPPPDNFAVFAVKRRSRSTSDVKGSFANTPVKSAHKSPRATRKIAPKLTLSPLRQRSISGERNKPPPMNAFLTANASQKHAPTSPRNTPHKHASKVGALAPRRKSLTQPKNPFTPKGVRSAARADKIRANPQAGPSRRTGDAQNSKSFDRSPSRSRLEAQQNGDLKKSPAKRNGQKPDVKGRGLNKDKNEGSVPMQNYGTVKF